jgi:hypothetical protein
MHKALGAVHCGRATGRLLTCAGSKGFEGRDCAVERKIQHVEPPAVTAPGTSCGGDFTFVPVVNPAPSQGLCALPDSPHGARALTSTRIKNSPCPPFLSELRHQCGISSTAFSAFAQGIIEVFL